MRQKIAGLFGSRISKVVMLVLVGLSLMGAAWGFKSSYIPGPVSAMQVRGERLQGYGSHAEFEGECLHCHAPVRCLSANLCQDCHLEVARERAESEGLHGLLPGTDKCHSCHGEHEGRDVRISDVGFGRINHAGFAGYSLELHGTDYAGEALSCQSCHQGGEHEATSEGCQACHVLEAPRHVRRVVGR